jgi:hypothetical protein
VPLPFPVELYERDFGESDSLQAFRELCAGAEVVELPLLPGDTPATIAEYGPRRDAHYARLGIYLCAHCHVLLAIWDGKPSDKLGGTAQVVRFHHWDEMPGFVERNEGQLQMLAEDESDLVYHLVCSRDQPDGEPAEGFVPLDGWWFTTDEKSRAAVICPPRTRRLRRAAPSSTATCASTVRRIKAGGWPLLPADAPATVVSAASAGERHVHGRGLAGHSFPVPGDRALRDLHCWPR